MKERINKFLKKEEVSDWFEKVPIFKFFYSRIPGDTYLRNTKMFTMLGLVFVPTIYIVTTELFPYLSTIISFVSPYEFCYANTTVHNLALSACLQLIISVFLFFVLDATFNSADKLVGYPERSFNYKDVAKRIQKAEIRVDIISIFLRVFTDPNKMEILEFDQLNGTSLSEKEKSKIESQKLGLENDLQKKKDQKVNNREIFIDALEKASLNCPVRILLLDPISHAARLRHHEIKESFSRKKRERLYPKAIKEHKLKDNWWFEDIHIINEIQKSLFELLKVYNNLENAKEDKGQDHFLQIRIYDRIPPYSFFKIDRYASFSFYPSEKTIQDADRWELKPGMPFEDFIKKTFNQIWDDEERTYSIDEYKMLRIEELGNESFYYVDILGRDSDSELTEYKKEVMVFLELKHEGFRNSIEEAQKNNDLFTIFHKNRSISTTISQGPKRYEDDTQGRNLIQIKYNGNPNGAQLYFTFKLKLEKLLH